MTVLTFSGEERDGRALPACTACSTNSVDIILSVVRVVIVENMSNILDILKKVSHLTIGCLQMVGSLMSICVIM